MADELQRHGKVFLEARHHSNTDIIGRDDGTSHEATITSLYMSWDM